GDNAAEVMAAILRDQPADLNSSSARLPPGLKQLVAQFLAKQPDQRFQSASELVHAFKAQTERAGSIPAVIPASSIRPCIAVLPLQNLSASKRKTEYVVDAMMEALIADLA